MIDEVVATGGSLLDGIAASLVLFAIKIHPSESTCNS